MYDMHTHTGFSDDCYVPYKDMLNAACDKGLEGIAVTDHWDPSYPDPEFPFILDFEKYHKAMDDAIIEYQGKLDIIKGIEIGIMDTEIDNIENHLANYTYDYIMASFHCYLYEDLYKLDFEKYDKMQFTKGYYEYVYECFSRFKDFNIASHFTILDRYIGGILDLGPSMDTIAEIFKMLINEGKGIEVNTSSFKYRMPVWLPRIELLKLYKDLGGEIITIGSDTHHKEYYGDHFDDAIELLKSLGFKAYCTFKKREAAFHDLP